MPVNSEQDCCWIVADVVAQNVPTERSISDARGYLTPFSDHRPDEPIHNPDDGIRVRRLHTRAMGEARAPQRPLVAGKSAAGP
jgi:hypothetical protein